MVHHFGKIEARTQATRHTRTIVTAEGKDYIGNVHSLGLLSLRVYSLGPATVGESSHVNQQPAPDNILDSPPRDSRLCRGDSADQHSPYYALGTLTLKLRLDLPRTGGKATEDIAIPVLEDHQAGPLVCDVAAQLGEALSVELCGEEQAPAVPLLYGQVGVEVEDRQHVQDALKRLPLIHVALGDQRGKVQG